jgi:hypothetical protein
VALFFTGVGGALASGVLVGIGTVVCDTWIARNRGADL